MTGGNGVSDLHNFLAQHKLQLEGAGVPSIYWDCLHTKLTKQIFDAGEQFTLLQVFVKLCQLSRFLIKIKISVGRGRGWRCGLEGRDAQGCDRGPENCADSQGARA